VVAHGPGLLLAALVAIVLAYPAGVVTVALVAVATSVRWGTAWLVPLGGAQAVLGPAVAVGPAPAALASGLCAAALVLAAPPAPAAAVALGVSAALVAAGPSGSSGILIRIGATVVATALAFGLGRFGRLRVRTVVAAALAAAALGAAVV
jgi:hypothetical protein